MSCFIPDAVYRGLKLSIGLPFEILTDVADERAGLGRRVDPDSVLVEDLERGDRVLEDKRQPWRLLASHLCPASNSMLL